MYVGTLLSKKIDVGGARYFVIIEQTSIEQLVPKSANNLLVAIVKQLTRT